MARCRGRGVDRAQSCRPLTRAVSHSTPWPDLLEPVALAVLDEPTQRVKHGAERRYGRRRSMTLHVDGPRRGTWKDFEESQGGASWPYRPTSRACTSLPPSIGCARRGLSTPTAQRSHPRARRRLPHSPSRTADAATTPAGCGIGRLQYLSTPATGRACGWRKITAGGQVYRRACPSPQRGPTRAR